MRKPPTWFIVVAVLAVLWNAMGLMAVVMDAMTTPEQLAALPANEQALHQARPGWSVVGSFAAVVAGTFGSLALLLRRRWAHPLLLVSLLGVLLQDAGLFTSAPAGAITPPVYVLQGLVLVIAVALVGLARRAIARQWLR